MSYDIAIVDPNGEVRQFDSPKHILGGTYAVGGSHVAEVNVTYNYSPFYMALWKGGIKSFDGMPAHDVADAMRLAIMSLGTEEDDDYWTATPGNAGSALQTIVSVIEDCPADSFIRVT